MAASNGEMREVPEDITARNSKESSLLRLPGELRNKIYKYATSGQIITLSLEPNGPGQAIKAVFHGSSSRGSVGDTNGASVAASNIDSLRAVCKQIRYESSAIEAYANNIFTFADPASYERFQGGLTFQQRRAVKVIAIQDIGYFLYHARRRQTPFRIAFPELHTVMVQTSMINERPWDAVRDDSKEKVERFAYYRYWMHHYGLALNERTATTLSGRLYRYPIWDKEPWEKSKGLKVILLEPTDVEIHIDHWVERYAQS